MDNGLIGPQIPEYVPVFHFDSLELGAFDDDDYGDDDYEPFPDSEDL